MYPRLRNLALSCIVIVSLALVVASGLSFAGKRGVKPHKLTILFTGDDLGTIKPCG